MINTEMCRCWIRVVPTAAVPGSPGVGKSPCPGLLLAWGQSWMPGCPALSSHRNHTAWTLWARELPGAGRPGGPGPALILGIKGQEMQSALRSTCCLDVPPTPQQAQAQTPPRPSQAGPGPSRPAKALGRGLESPPPSPTNPTETILIRANSADMASSFCTPTPVSVFPSNPTPGFPCDFYCPRHLRENRNFVLWAPSAPAYFSLGAAILGHTCPLPTAPPLFLRMPPESGTCEVFGLWPQLGWPERVASYLDPSSTRLWSWAPGVGS